MKLVVDTNWLQSDKLKAFLEARPKNIAVLTDLVAMEIYKPDNVASVYKAMETIAQHPRQVLVLKNTHKVLRLHGRPKGLQRRLVDEASTQEFEHFCRELRRGQGGDYGVYRQLCAYGDDARRRMAVMENEARARKSEFASVLDGLSSDERRVIRNDEPWTVSLTKKIGERIVAFSRFMVSSAPRGSVCIADFPDMPNTYVFRWAVCDFMMVLRRAVQGGVDGAKDVAVRNDAIDARIAAYATYFDGVASSDRSVNRLHDQGRVIIAGLFGGASSVAR